MVDCIREEAAEEVRSGHISEYILRVDPTGFAAN